MKSFNLEILTPSKKAFTGTVESLTVTTTVGQVGILAEHTPLLAIITTSPLHLVIGTKHIFYAISGGVLSVQNDKTIILADAIEHADEIDIQRALKAKTRAEKRIQAKQQDLDLRRAQIALQRAITRIKVYNDTHQGS